MASHYSKAKYIDSLWFFLFVSFILYLPLIVFPSKSNGQIWLSLNYLLENKSFILSAGNLYTALVALIHSIFPQETYQYYPSLGVLFLGLSAFIYFLFLQKFIELKFAMGCTCMFLLLCTFPQLNPLDLNPALLALPLFLMSSLFFQKAFEAKKLKSFLISGTFLALSILIEHKNILLIFPLSTLLFFLAPRRISLRLKIVFLFLFVPMITLFLFNIRSLNISFYHSDFFTKTLARPDVWIYFMLILTGLSLLIYFTRIIAPTKGILIFLLFSLLSPILLQSFFISHLALGYILGTGLLAIKRELLIANTKRFSIPLLLITLLGIGLSWKDYFQPHYKQDLAFSKKIQEISSPNDKLVLFSPRSNLALLSHRKIINPAYQDLIHYSDLEKEKFYEQILKHQPNLLILSTSNQNQSKKVFSRLDSIKENLYEYQFSIDQHDIYRKMQTKPLQIPSEVIEPEGTEPIDLPAL